MKIQQTIEHLSSELDKAIQSDFLNYEQTKKIKSCGIYFIFQGEKVIYIGKTNRNGKTRLRELASDYRSHTLNRKFMRILLSQVLKTDFPPLKKETKHQLITKGILTQEQFVTIQAKINHMIKTELRFKFYSTEPENVIQMEHFAIGVLNPEMND